MDLPYGLLMVSKHTPYIGAHMHACRPCSGTHSRGGGSQTHGTYGAHHAAVDARALFTASRWAQPADGVCTVAPGAAVKLIMAYLYTGMVTSRHCEDCWSAGCIQMRACGSVSTEMTVGWAGRLCTPRHGMAKMRRFCCCSSVEHLQLGGPWVGRRSAVRWNCCRMDRALRVGPFSL